MIRYSGRILGVLFVTALLLLPAPEGLAESRIMRDPFAPPDLKRTKSSTVVSKPGKSRGEMVREEAARLTLRGIIRNGDWAMANINGTMVEEGDTIEGFTLLWVGDVDVLLRKEGVEVVLVMQTGSNLPTQ
ncbi:MAG: hypothetical protein R3297_06970 [Desulfobulbales bacterium]|nr:hypothetical protein [Desulfobulbales bacterium]